MNAETEIRAALAAVVEHRKQYDDLTKRVSHADAVAVGHAFRAAVNHGNIAALLAELDVRQTKIDALRKDADRVDWLDNEIACPIGLQSGKYLNLSDKDLRHVLDAAMVQAKKGGAT